MRKDMLVLEGDDAPTPVELKRRTRAVWAYSLKEQKELAEECGVPYNTLRGLLGATGPTPSVEVAWAIARACGVPRSFISDGFVNPRSDDEQIQHLLLRLMEMLPDAGRDDLRTVIETSRQMTARHVLDADADRDDPAESDTRDGADASREDRPVPLEEMRHTAGDGDG